MKYGREEGIRTLETFRFTHFPGVRLQPLGHLSINFQIVALVIRAVILCTEGARRMRVIRHVVCLTPSGSKSEEH